MQNEWPESLINAHTLHLLTEMSLDMPALSHTDAPEPVPLRTPRSEVWPQSGY